MTQLGVLGGWGVSTLVWVHHNNPDAKTEAESSKTAGRVTFLWKVIFHSPEQKSCVHSFQQHESRTNNCALQLHTAHWLQKHVTDWSLTSVVLLLEQHFKCTDIKAYSSKHELTLATREGEYKSESQQGSKALTATPSLHLLLDQTATESQLSPGPLQT